MYLIERDLFRAVQQAELTILTENSPNDEGNDLNEVILSVQEEMEAYIRHRYDISQEFIKLRPWVSSDTYLIDEHTYLTAPAWVSGTAYNSGDYVSRNGKVYYSAFPNNLETPGTGTQWFETGDNNSYYIATIDGISGFTFTSGWTKVGDDPRSPLLVRIAVDLTLYELHARIKPRQIPEHRIVKREDGIRLLKDLADPRKNVRLDIPLVDHADQRGNDLTYGGDDRSYHTY